jgi:hypothetical protein
MLIASYVPITCRVEIEKSGLDNFSFKWRTSKVDGEWDLAKTPI